MDLAAKDWAARVRWHGAGVRHATSSRPLVCPVHIRRPGRPRLVQQLEKGLTARGWVVDKLQIRRKAVTGRGIGRRVLNGFATLIGFASAPADSQYSDDELLQGNVARHAEKNLKFDLVFERCVEV